MKPHFLVSLMSIYLLGLNLLYLCHSIEHQYIPVELAHCSKKKNTATIQKINTDTLCGLCDVFQEQIYFYSAQHKLTFSSSLFNVVAEKPSDQIIIRSFALRLRGPPRFI